MTNPNQSTPPAIAFAMADDYPWDLIRKQQLPDVDFEVWDEWAQWSEAELARRLRGVTAIVTGRKSPSLPAALAADPGQLRAVIHCHGSIRKRASEAHLRAGITVTNWGKNAGAGVAMGALTLLLCCLHQVPSLHAFAMSDRTDDGRIHQNYPRTLRGAKVGLYGFGPIGRHMEALLRPFSPHVAIYDPHAEAVPPDVAICASLEELFDRSDMISIHCGLNDQTRNSITGDLLDRLPQGGILINTARGAIVDEDALAERVHAGRLLAGLDVVRNEGRWSATPLAGTPNAILTAHRISSPKGPEPHLRGPRLLPDFVVHNIYAVLNNTPLQNAVTAEEYAIKT